MERTDKGTLSDISIDDLLLYLKESVYRRGYWGRVTITFREGNPVGIIQLEETRKIVPRKT